MAALPRFDLQSHSRHSDGALSPEHVVAAAAAAGVELLALTDHDSVDGVAAALEAARRHGLRLIPAAEISALHDEHEDLHILGYGIDPGDRGLQDALARYRADRDGRAERMADAFRQAGLAVESSDLQQRAERGLATGRPHLAQAVFTHPDNRGRLEREGIDSPEALLVAYLLPGRPAYRGRTLPRVPEVIDVIHAAGGVAVWAHPFWDVKEPDRVQDTLRAFAADGIDGVEAFYVTHDENQTRVCHEVAAELGLLTTGSSDFHGPEHRLFSRFLAHRRFGLLPRLGPLLDG